MLDVGTLLYVEKLAPPIVLASVLMGEAGLCPFTALVAAAYVCQRSACYGDQPPNENARIAAALWYLLPDPSLGAQHLVSRQDLQQQRVRHFTSDRGPPLVKWECAGGLEIYAFR